MQQPSAQPTYGHYPYTSHYAGYAASFSTQTPAAAQGQAGRHASQPSGMNTSDLAMLNDALGSAGVDLRVPPNLTCYNRL